MGVSLCCTRSDDMVVMYDNTTMMAFGPVIEDHSDLFIKWWESPDFPDVREPGFPLEDLHAKLDEWINAQRAKFHVVEEDAPDGGNCRWAVHEDDDPESLVGDRFMTEADARDAIAIGELDYLID